MSVKLINSMDKWWSLRVQWNRNQMWWFFFIIIHNNSSNIVFCIETYNHDKKLTYQWRKDTGFFLRIKNTVSPSSNILEYTNRIPQNTSCGVILDLKKHSFLLTMTCIQRWTKCRGQNGKVWFARRIIKLMQKKLFFHPLVSWMCNVQIELNYFWAWVLPKKYL